MEAIAVYAIVAVAVTGMLVRLFGKRRPPTCGAGCGGCSCPERPKPLVNIRR
jgi:hypothetical protein